MRSAASQVLQITAAVTAAFLAACGGSTVAPPATGTVSVTSTKDSVQADGTTATLTITVADSAGAPATGSVHVFALAGKVNSKLADDVTLAAGVATVLFSCDSALDSKCKATTATVGVTWNGSGGSITFSLLHGSTVVDAGTDAGTTDAGTDGGTTDAGPGDGGVTTAPINAKIVVAGINPPVIFSSDAAAVGLPVSAVITFGVTLVSGEPLAGAAVTFTTTIGEDLVLLSASSTLTDANGIANVKVSSKTLPGIAHINANAAGVAVTIAAIPIVGPPASVVETAADPVVLGLKGSGIQEHGLMKFLVSDAFGSPVPNAQIDFTQSQPNLVTFNNTTGRTDGTGVVSVGYSSGLEVGVTTISATVHNGTVQGSHQVAVRGARPSASGFYFRCDHGSLSVYDTITQLATMKCHVRLSDRFGNRVGIPTPVNFATEAGAISASAVTKGFDINNPNDPLEGTVDVTFTTDVGNGLGPADVDPLPADGAQYPFPRAAEPFRTVGSLKYNPRDQLVTLIAWTQGEEAFVDANHNGKYDAGELFVDEGDPFIDANDNNLYDQVTTGGQWELRFCAGTNGNGGICPAYQPPNGKWDSLTTIWVPTWVVFTGGMVPSSSPSFGTGPTTQFTPSCADYSDSPPSLNPNRGSYLLAPVYVYDAWYNTPAAGTSYTYNFIDPTITLPPIAQGFVAEAESYGAMGSYGVDFDYRAVSAQGGACNTANGSACVLKLSFLGYDDGYRGTLVIQNPTKKPTAINYACSVPAGGGQPASSGDPGAPPPHPFTMYVVATPPGGKTGEGIRGYFSGSYAVAP